MVRASCIGLVLLLAGCQSIDEVVPYEDEGSLPAIYEQPETVYVPFG